MTERVMVVTGAAGDLGGAVAARMAKRGDRVVLVDASAERLAARAAELGGGTVGEVFDVTDEGAGAALGTRSPQSTPATTVTTSKRSGVTAATLSGPILVSA